MTTSEQYIFKYSEGRELHLLNPTGVFTPTGTTDALVKAARLYLKKPGKLLDLGCGNGVAGIAAHQLGFVHEPLFSSDLSQDAVDVTILNAAKYNCAIEARSGSIFEPWKGECFDYILNDISGIATRVAQISPWFNSVPCSSGEDGADLIIEMLLTAKKHLNKEGALFFPIISLSNVERILKVAGEEFKNLKRLSSDEWPMPKEMSSHTELLDELAEANVISFTKRFGLMTYYTDIYVATN